MKSLTLTALVLLASGCSILPSDGAKPDVEQVLKQQEVILNAMMLYVSKLQEAGILPKPEELKEKLGEQ